jgi:NTF2-related export protein 1/2
MNSTLEKLDNTSCDIADAFTEAYYQAQTADRQSIADFYVPTAIDELGAPCPTIVWNGHQYNDAKEFQIYVQGLSFLHSTVETLDCHVLNPKFLSAAKVKGGSGNDDADLERRMAIMVYVSGSIRLGQKLKGPLRLFSESFVLVPNADFEPAGPQLNSVFKGKDRDGVWKHPFLIQNQNFSFTEWGEGELNMGEDGKPVVAETLGEPPKGFGKNKGLFNAFAAAGLVNTRR